MSVRMPFSSRFHYAWVIAAVTFLVLIGASGVRSAPGVLMVPLQEAFGWDRGTIALAISINLLLYGFMGPFAAAAVERYGVRTVVVTALGLIASGALLTLRMTEPWQLYLSWGVLVGMGSGCVPILNATVSSRWFVEKRGLVTGVLAAGMATGQLIFLPIIAWMASRYGWQAVSIAVVLLAVSVVPIVVLFMRDRPADVGLRRFGAHEDDAPPGPRGNPVRMAYASFLECSRSSAFWILCATFFVCGATTNGLIGTHLIPAAHDHGIGEVAAANMLAIIGVFDIIGTIGSGWLTDRFDPRKLLFAYYFLRGISLMGLTYVLGSVNFGMIAFVVVYGLDWVATVPPTIVLCTQVFGIRKGPFVYGWVFASHQLGAALLAWLAGMARTVNGDYMMTFIAAGFLGIIAAIMILQLDPTPVDNEPPIMLAPASGD